MNLIVFDIDGTLTESLYQHSLAYVNTMKELGITEIDDNWSAYLHHTDSYILKENYIANFKKQFDSSFIDLFELRMTENILKLKKVDEIRGARAFLKSLEGNSNYAVAFATGSLLKPAFIKLNQAGIPYTEQLVIGSNQCFDREGIVNTAIEQAKEFYKVDSFDNIISVGDGIWDMKTASNLGLHFIGIGRTNKKDFENENILLHINDWIGFDLSKAEISLGII